eukprot:CAMPEP_0203645046 /NCGR_PEP_ID=MMETSP0088-20131115/10430_1 /ASSEMBLY_ACC=CAM_ASM_001087 /TAXON_ID=426623 /ORGANISM="Chaetoceros affinis, Strain CCMP159" /LENGTH=55 /DNA_ID=CAMNT_0050501727 /DNA_START=121 /DNA_END=288 /DNA_ORIENTATION=+
MMMDGMGGILLKVEAVDSEAGVVQDQIGAEEEEEEALDGVDRPIMVGLLVDQWAK